MTEHRCQQVFRAGRVGQVDSAGMVTMVGRPDQLTPVDVRPRWPATPMSRSGAASAGAAGWPGQAMMGGGCPAGEMRTWSRDGLNIAHITVAIASGSKCRISGRAGPARRRGRLFPARIPAARCGCGPDHRCLEAGAGHVADDGAHLARGEDEHVAPVASHMPFARNVAGGHLQPADRGQRRGDQAALQRPGSRAVQSDGGGLGRQGGAVGGELAECWAGCPAPAVLLRGLTAVRRGFRSASA